MKKKVLSVLLAAAMVFSLAACGGSDGGSAGGDNTGGDTQQEEPSGGDEGNADANVDDGAAGGDEGGTTVSIPLDGTWPEETVKIGMVEYDTTSEQFQAIEAYYDYLSQYFNIELMYSESLSDAEGELNFINDCAAAGCVAIIGRYNESKEQAALAAAEQGMYYVGGFGGDSASYEKVKDNEYYLGAYTLGEGDYEAGRSLALGLAEQGKEKVVLVSGGASMGIPQFVNRKQGVLDGIEEAKANGSNIEIVYEVEGWPDSDAFAAAQTTVLDMDIDSIASTLDPFMWFQPIAQAGKADSVSIACIGEVSDTYYDAFNSGMVSCIVYDTPDTVFGSCIPMILNAVTGNKLVNADGSAIYFPVERFTITDPEIFNKIYDMHENDEYLVSAEDMANLIVALNPDMTAEEFMKYYGSFNIDSVR